MFEGSLVAIVTPFRNGNVDYDSLENLIEFQIKNGTHGIVSCGTTGESPTLSHEEHQQVVKTTVEIVNKRLPVIAGTGSNSTQEAVSLTGFAQSSGADGAMVVVPYYNKPTQRGLYRHFREIADNTSIPIILYNVPGRTGVSISAETTAELAQSCSNIIGIKEASGSISHASTILSLCGRDFLLFSGEDALNLPLLAIGGKGFITVTANIVPHSLSELYETFRKGDTKRATDLHYYLHPLNEALFCESNPIPVKTALSIMGMIECEFRSPLVEMSESNRAKLENTLRDSGLIK